MIMELFFNSKSNLLYYKQNNSWYRVLAILNTTQDANNYLKNNKNSGVLATNDPYIIIVDIEDMGRKTM